MNILIVGGNGFIGKYLTERLLAFNHAVSIIDIADKPKNFYLKRKAKYYQLNALSKECREVFFIGQFDIVYFMVGNSNEKGWLDNGKEISILLNILSLSHEFKVKKFIYASTTYLYDYEAMKREISYNNYPEFFLYCTNKKSCETYCNIYKDLYAMNMLIVRIPPIYGPEQNNYGEGSILINILDSFSHKATKEVYSIFKDIELIYIADAARTLTSTVLASNFNGSCRLKGDLFDIRDIVKDIGRLFNDEDIKLKYRFNSKIKYSLNANSINRREDNTTLSDGIRKTYEWFKRSKKKTFSDKISNNIVILTWKRYKPWIEAAIFSFLVISFTKYMNSSYDTAVIIIMILGLIYGINVALFAVGLCMAFYYIPFYKPVQIDIYAIERFFAYLSIALISGYKKTAEFKSKRIQSETHIELEKLFGIVQTDLVDTRKSASLLAEELKTSEYSYPTLYNAIKKLNDNENQIMEILPEVIFELTGFSDITIETKNNLSQDLPDIENEIILNSFERNRIYFSTEFKSSIRIIIPLFNKKTNTVDSLIVLRNIPFEQMNVNLESRINFIYNLVTDYYNNNVESLCGG